jgi:hypothetical protein
MTVVVERALRHLVALKVAPERHVVVLKDRL